MKRRDFITLLGGAAVWPVAARAQQATKLPTIGYLGSATLATESQRMAAFVQRLRELGWIEGRTVVIDYRWAEGRTERYAEIAAEFVRLKVDVIVTVGGAVAAAKQATATIPIVFAGAGDPESGAAWSPRWHNRAAMSPGCPFNPPTSPASDSRFCARFSLMFAGWRSLAM